MSEVTGFLSISDQLRYLWGTNCFGNGTREYSTCLYESGEVNTYFFPTPLFRPI